MLSRGWSNGVLVAVGLGASVLCAVSGGLVSPWSPFVAQDVGQGAWLAVRATLLAALLLSACGADDGPPPRPWLATIGILGTLSTLVARGLLVPWMILTVALLVWSGGPRLGSGVFRKVSPVASQQLVLVVVIALAAAGWWGAKVSAPRKDWVASMPEAPELAMREWLAHDNRWRARHAASKWAWGERSDPGRGHLALAELEASLGRGRAALELLRLVEARSSDVALRDEARRRIASASNEPRP